MKKYEFNGDSFGANCPENWEEICEYLNSKVEDGMDSDDVEEIWRAYCNGEYADAPEAK